MHLLTCLKPYTTFQSSFRALLCNIWLRINKTLGVLTFLGHSVVTMTNENDDDNDELKTDNFYYFTDNIDKLKQNRDKFN